MRTLYTRLIVVFLVLLAFQSAFAEGYKGPIGLIPTKDGQFLYVLNKDSKEIVVVKVADAKIERSISLPKTPNSMTISADEKIMYVAAGEHDGSLYAVNLAEGKITVDGKTGHSPIGISIAPDGKKLYVCYRFNHCLAEMEIPSLKELRRFPALNEPINSVINRDGSRVFIANFLPNDPSDGADVAAEITMVELPSGKTKNIRLPNGSSSMHGIILSPDGKYVFTTAILARYQLPTSQLERGWMNTNGFSIIDAQKGDFINTVLLDDVDLGAANPWPIAVSPDSKKVYVGLAGTHELCTVEIDKVLEKIFALPKNPEEAKKSGVSAVKTALDVPQDLAFLVGMKKRTKLGGKAPRSLAVIGNKVYAGMYFDDKIVVLDTSLRRQKAKDFIALGPKPEMTPERLGELHWHDATLCFQHWQSCASCHPDARTDALNWDLLNDGNGNPKNAKSMLFAINTPPAMWQGVRASAEIAIRTGFQYILFAVRPEEEYKEIEAYLKAMKPAVSPYLVNGQLSEAAKRGKLLFESEKLACSKCHFGEYYTDQKIHDVGSRASYDHQDDFYTPLLREAWRTRPYMHDGRFVKMKDVFKVGNHGDVLGNIAELKDSELDDLVEYIMSL